MIEALLSADHVEIQFDIPASVINALLWALAHYVGGWRSILTVTRL